MNKFLTHNEDPAICINGTHLQGHLDDVSYDQLYLTFGRHVWVDGPDKVDWEWNIEFPCGTVATIYNYKNGPNYCGAGGMNRHQGSGGHVGGNQLEAGDLIKAALSEGGAA